MAARYEPKQHLRGRTARSFDLMGRVLLFPCPFSGSPELSKRPRAIQPVPEIRSAINDHSSSNGTDRCVADLRIDSAAPSCNQKAECMTAEKENAIDECPFFGYDKGLVAMIVGVIQQGVQA